VIVKNKPLKLLTNEAQ